MPARPLWRECVAECIGTFLLVLIGLGVNHAAVIQGAQAGLWQIAIVWGLGVALAIYCVGAISGAHINPAMTVAFALFRKFSWGKVAPYVMSQLIGAFLAAALLHATYGGAIERFEAANHIQRGQDGSQLSAKVYGEYFPDPHPNTTPQDEDAVPLWRAMLAEIVGTALLAFLVFGLTDQHNPGRPDGTLAALLIGLGVAVIISFVSPLTQSCLNPARDFGPRVLAWLAGWGRIAIPGPRGGFFTVYILSPIVGGVLGGGIFQFFLHSGMKASVSNVKTEQQGES